MIIFYIFGVSHLSRFIIFIFLNVIFANSHLVSGARIQTNDLSVASLLPRTQ